MTRRAEEVEERRYTALAGADVGDARSHVYSAPPPNGPKVALSTPRRVPTLCARGTNTPAPGTRPLLGRGGQFLARNQARMAMRVVSFCDAGGMWTERRRAHVNVCCEHQSRERAFQPMEKQGADVRL